MIISGPATIAREQPFTRLNPAIQSLVNAQMRLVNRFASEAKEILEKAGDSSDEKRRGSLKLLQV